MTTRQYAALFCACLLMLLGVFAIWDGRDMSAIACAVMALVAALLGRIP